jgi:hypothetical protein
MKIFVSFLAWFVLLALAWPLAIAVLILFPIFWVLSIPFRIVGMVFEALFAFLRALLLLPARLLGYRPAR